MDTEFIEKSLDSSYEEWFKQLTEEEKNAVNRYTTNQYKKINGYLRTKEDILENEKIEKDIVLIDSALNKFNLKIRFFTYRVEFRDINEKELFIENLKTDKRIDYCNYCSTSIDEDIINSWIAKELSVNSNSLVLKIKALVSPDVNCAFIKLLSEFEEEKELLVARNVSLFIYSEPVINNNIIEVTGILKSMKGED